MQAEPGRGAMCVIFVHISAGFLCILTQIRCHSPARINAAVYQYVNSQNSEGGLLRQPQNCHFVERNNNNVGMGEITERATEVAVMM